MDKPSGYFQSFDIKSGARIEGETRMCVHCGFQWVKDISGYLQKKIGLRQYDPSKAIRGTCMKCRGLVCARTVCLKNGCVPLAKQIENMEIKIKRLS